MPATGYHDTSPPALTAPPARPPPARPQWGCCPIPGATCCDDKEHCCPSDLPVCDTAAGRCMPKAGVALGSRPWYTKTPALQRHAPQGMAAKALQRIFGNRGFLRRGEPVA
jgi:KDEL-tailed cysteine endopeptidase